MKYLLIFLTMFLVGCGSDTTSTQWEYSQQELCRDSKLMSFYSSYYRDSSVAYCADKTKHIVVSNNYKMWLKEKQDER